MVPLNIDIYKLKNEIKNILIKRINIFLNINKYSLDFAWIVYAFSQNGIDNNPNYDKSINNLENWMLNLIRPRKKDLAALSICRYLTRKSELKYKAFSLISNIINAINNDHDILKFSILNDSEQIFCLSLGIKDSLDKIDDIKKILLKIRGKKIGGNIIRKLLYWAAKFELGMNNQLNFNFNPSNIDEAIICIWFFKRYNVNNINIISYWETLQNILYSIDLNSISTRTLSFFYEIIVSELKLPNPNLIFYLFPFDPEFKIHIEKYFFEKNYGTAVFEATKKLNELIQQKTDRYNVDFSGLVQSTMRKKSPVIFFSNDSLDKTTRDSIHNGLTQICDGIFKAFRNPLGHLSETHPNIEISSYDALSQLIIIDYIWKKIKNAKIF